MRLVRLFFLVIVVGICSNSFSQTSSLKKSGINKSLFEKDSMAFLAFESGKLEEAEQFAMQVIEEEKDTSFFLVNAYTLLGIINKNRGYYISAIENYLRAIEFAEVINDQGRISACLNNIGVIYQLQHNFELAISYFNKSLVIEETKDNHLQRSIRYYNLAECYREIDSLDLALSFYNNSLIIEEKFKNNEGILYAYIGIADVYLKLQNSYQAKLIIDKIQPRLTNTNPELNLLFYKLNGNYFALQKKFTEALTQFDKAWEISISINNKSFLLELILAQISCFEEIGDISKVNINYKKYIELQDEFNNSEIKNKIDDLVYKSELAKRELEIKLVQEERSLAIANAKHLQVMRLFEQRLMWFIFIVLIVTIGMVVYGLKKFSNIKE